MEVEVEDDDDDDASSAIELGLAEAAGVTNAHERFTDRYVLTQLVRSDCARAFGIPTAAVEVELRTRHVSDEEGAEEGTDEGETTTTSRRLLGDEEDQQHADEAPTRTPPPTPQPQPPPPPTPPPRLGPALGRVAISAT